MKIAVDQITESPKKLRFEEDSEGLNRIFEEEENDDFRFPTFLNVDVVYYRSGQELFFRGLLATTVEGRCSRCLKKYAFPLEKEFSCILTPGPLPVKSGEVSYEEMGMSFYSTDEIDLSPLVREQALLALPTRPLCDDRCRGLCVGCGVDLNDESCRCPSRESDPRMHVFRTLKSAR
jgi:uncharacterized protein